MYFVAAEPISTSDAMCTYRAKRLIAKFAVAVQEVANKHFVVRIGTVVVVVIMVVDATVAIAVVVVVIVIVAVVVTGAATTVTVDSNTTTMATLAIINSSYFVGKVCLADTAKVVL
jgi:hypothetical protein